MKILKNVYHHSDCFQNAFFFMLLLDIPFLHCSNNLDFSFNAKYFFVLSHYAQCIGLLKIGGYFFDNVIKSTEINLLYRHIFISKLVKMC